MTPRERDRAKKAYVVSFWIGWLSTIAAGYLGWGLIGFLLAVGIPLLAVGIFGGFWCGRRDKEHDMDAIWKWRLKVVDEQTLPIPEGASVLSVQVQNGHICLWARVNPDAPTVDRGFRIAGTGHPVPVAPGYFVGTVQLDDGALVFHIFDLGEVTA